MNSQDPIKQFLKFIYADEQNWEKCDFVIERIDKGYITEFVPEPVYESHFNKEEMDDWCNLHCSGDWISGGGIWYFEAGKDATMFRLRWYG